MSKSIINFFQKKEKVSDNPALSLEAFNLLTNIFECNTLKTKNEIIASTQLIELFGFHPHSDSQKNWDTLKCMFYLVRGCKTDLPILDAGGSPDSSVLNSLSKFGFDKLYACDIVDMKQYSKIKNNNVIFSVQNIENTNYENEYFQAVLCLSVIEHGINMGKFFPEMNRIIKENGLLLITTDYWDEYINCDGIYPYGTDKPQMKVFQKSEIENICNIAQSCGFSLCNKLDTTTYEKAVRWETVDREYTFIFLAFRKNRL